MGRRKAVVVLIFVLGLSGCMGGFMGKQFTRLGLWQDTPASVGPLMPPVIAPPPAAQGSAKPHERLTLARALWLAYIYNPELAAFSFEMRVRDARVLQAGLSPNPELGVEVENFGGTGEASGSETTETTIALSQLIPLGGKIRKRVQVAGFDRELAAWDYEAKRLEVMKEVTRRFVRVLAARERLELAQEEIDLAETVYDVANKRFRAGDTSIVDKTRAEAVLATSRIDIKKAQYELAAARQALSAMWGSVDPKFDRVVGNLHEIRPVPNWRSLASWISRNPDVARWASEMSKRWAELRLAKAENVPDMTFGFGIRRINQPDGESEDGGTVPVPNDTALVAELSMPLPVLDRNQGNILAAQSDLAKGEQESRAAWIRTQTALAQSYNALLASHTEAAEMRSTVIPALQSAFEGIRKGYRQGKIGYLDLLDAQKSLIDERRRYIEALGNYHDGLADLEALIGEPLRDIQ